MQQALTMSHSHILTAENSLNLISHHFYDETKTEPAFSAARLMPGGFCPFWCQALATGSVKK
jgi:hypothetical protein